eukprot:TRINITY_DN39214_c0_g1_i1.p1 TRINITY_DN39214_c0_g1~~TRINITY_DN39214_c0_g1_i1.p1  ORF type:complete len:291 (-),score=56.32 TRINITY_DN39214_c0_g1_i1:473-1345(-)
MSAMAPASEIVKPVAIPIPETAAPARESSKMPPVYLTNTAVAAFTLPQRDGNPNRKVILRTFKEPHDDAQELFDVVSKNRKKLRAWLPWLDRTQTVEHEKGFIEFVRGEGELEFLGEDAFQAGQPTTFSHTVRPKKALALILEVDGKIAGQCGFNAIDWNRKIGFIGYWLGEEFAGGGVMTKAVRELMKFGFDQLGLDHIDITFAKENKKSQGVVQRVIEADEAEENAAKQEADYAPHYTARHGDFGGYQMLYDKKFESGCWTKSRVAAAEPGEVVRAEVAPPGIEKENT